MVSSTSPLLLAVTEVQPLPFLRRKPSEAVAMPIPQKKQQPLRSLVGVSNKLLTYATGVTLLALDIFFNRGRGTFIAGCLAMGGAAISRAWHHYQKESTISFQKMLKPSHERGAVPDLQFLKHNGYLPKHKFVLDNVTYYCSSVFHIMERPAVFALVKHPSGVYPRIFYLSNSQAIWRTLPSKGFKGTTLCFGKTKHEYFTNLPFNLCFELNRLPKVDKEWQPVTDYLIAMQEEDLTSKSFFSKLQSTPLVEDSTEGLVKYPQNYKLLRTELYPDFSKLLRSEEFKTALYGNLKGRVFPSTDGSRKYLFLVTASDKVFFAGSEQVASPINEFGVRERMDTLGKMASPLMEYTNQIERGYNTSSLREGPYQDNWKYVQELEMVQLYCKHHFGGS